MHEAGIATLIVAALQEQNPPGPHARVRVRGGHTDAKSFDAALRLYLAAADSQLDLSRVEIVHLPHSLKCATCSHSYEAEDAAAACPRCGGAAWPDYAPEEVELELLEEVDVAGAGKSACV
jgi:Zn finger protein HypA/HybF involved in hydrogenase expression